MPALQVAISCSPLDFDFRLNTFDMSSSKTEKIRGNKWQAEPFSWKAACCPTKCAAKEAAGSAHAVSF
jgi:hypothetical protein